VQDTWLAQKVLCYQYVTGTDQYFGTLRYL
jgi:hypothetical protein